MNKSVILILAFAMACSTSPLRQAEESESAQLSGRIAKLKGPGPRKRVLLLPILNQSVERSSNVSKTGRDALVRGLKLTDNFVILDNIDVPKDLSQFQKGDSYDLEEVAKVAAEMGASAVIEGRVLEIKAKRSGDEVGMIRSVRAEVVATVGVRVFSANNQKEMLNEVRSATSQSTTRRVLPTSKESLTAEPELIYDALASAFKGMILPISKAVDKLNWAGKIALVNGDRIYVNAGRITGLNIGDILRVTEEGESVYDPDSGIFIGRAPGHMKGTIEIVSYFGKDGAIGIIHSGSGFHENDRVEPY